jgi:hypothetical protein
MQMNLTHMLHSVDAACYWLESSLFLFCTRPKAKISHEGTEGHENYSSAEIDHEGTNVHEHYSKVEIGHEEALSRKESKKIRHTLQGIENSRLVVWLLKGMGEGGCSRTRSS